MVGVYILNSGTGMQNKILEALACGLPVVASPLAVQGVPGLTGKEIIVSTNREEIIESIEHLINNEENRIELSLNGQKFILENYSWESNVERLMNIWHNAILQDKNGNKRAPI